MATQLGTTLNIGFGSHTLTNYIMESFSRESTDNQVEEIFDEAGATETIILMNPGERINFTAVQKDAASLDPSDIGASVTINAILYRIESWSVDQTAGATRTSVTAIKEDSMTYV